MVICYIGIGSNLGDRRQYIESAVRRVKALAGTKVDKVSSIIESEPQGGPAQGQYLNAVCRITTDLDPYELLRQLQRIEAALGRVRTVVNGPRTIDLDILTYGDIAMDEPALRIPHPRTVERAFVLGPLAEIAPEVAGKLLGLSKKAAKKEKKKIVRVRKSSRKRR